MLGSSPPPIDLGKSDRIFKNCCIGYNSFKLFQFCCAYGLIRKQSDLWVIRSFLLKVSVTPPLGTSKTVFKTKRAL